MTRYRLLPRRRLAEVALITTINVANRVDDGRINPSESLRLPAPSRLLNPRDLAVVEIVSVVESYVDSLLQEILRGQLHVSDNFARLLLLEVEQTSTATWEARRSAFGKYVGTELTGIDGYNDLDSAIELRNCLVHGLGHLTAKQREKRGLATKVAKIGVATRGGQMHSSSATLGKVRAAALKFIRSLDSTTG
jgi:hypothetical protein